ncbi:MAG: hypothetical protein ABSF96_15605, partial [Steroidobacteraceae bacterium]
MSREINSYVTYGSSELDTSAALRATWQATRTITVVAGYQWIHSNFPGSNLVDLGSLERVDTYQLSNLSVKYQV